MKFIASLLFVSCAFALAGCNTLEGVGQDVQKAGQVIQDAAKKK